MEGRVEDFVLDHEVFDSLNYESCKATLENLLHEMELAKPCNIQLNWRDKTYRAEYKGVASKRHVYMYRGKLKSYEEVSTHLDPKI
jgi:hypothetical protein